MLNLTATLFPGLGLDRPRPRGILVGEIVRSAREWLRYQRSLRELQALDDRMLDDIGIAREDFPELARRHARGLEPMVRA